MESTEKKRIVTLDSGVSFYLGEDNYCCRCCLAEGAIKPLSKERNLLYYTSCTQIAVKAGDGLPKYVCKGCCKKLASFYKFLKMCEKSYHQLQNAIKSSIGKNRTIKHEDNSAYCDNNPDLCLKNEKDTGSPAFNEEWDSDDEKSISTVHTLDNKCKEKYKKFKLLKSNIESKVSKTYNKNNTIRLINCPTCNTEVRKNLLKRHMEIHNLEKPLYHCKICKKSFKSSNHFERHDKSNFIVCQICGKSIFNKTYEIHIKRHNKQKDYTCETCGQKFYQRSLLKHHHLDRHMGRKYTCDYCKKEFVTKFAIRTHIYRHSETPRFKCNMCEKAYRSHWILTLHKRTHTGIQPYKCGSCQRGFSNLSQMKRHKISHTEERRFVCEYCNYAYKYKTSYRRHLERCKKRKEKIIN